MSNQNAPTGAVTLTAEQLQQMLVTMAKELRKPADLTPAQIAQAESDKAMREETARLQRARVEKVAQDQAACVHRRKDRSTHCVFEYSGGFLICQGCQAIIRPEPRPTGDAAKETSHHIYNTRMFNEHFTESQSGPTTF